MKVRMLTPYELASWAEETAIVHGLPYSFPEERVMVMLSLIEKYHYHIIAPDIRDACRKKAGCTA